MPYPFVPRHPRIPSAARPRPAGIHPARHNSPNRTSHVIPEFPFKGEFMRSFRAGMMIFLTTVLLVMAKRHARASCGSASCPLDTRSSFVSEKGLARVAYEFEYID